MIPRKDEGIRTVKKCRDCIPYKDCPNFKRIVDDGLAETCKCYLSTNDYAEVLLRGGYSSNEQAMAMLMCYTNRAMKKGEN